MTWLTPRICFATLGVVLALGPRSSAAQQDVAAEQEPDGKALYEQRCKSCHGPAGGAPSPAMVRLLNVPSITDPTLLAKTSDDSLMRVIEMGRGKMPPWANKLSHEQIVAIVKFLRTFAAAGGEEESRSPLNSTRGSGQPA